MLAAPRAANLAHAIYLKNVRYAVDLENFAGWLGCWWYASALRTQLTEMRTKLADTEREGGRGRSYRKGCHQQKNGALGCH